MAFSGTVNSITLPDFLQLLGLSRKTGTLIIITPRGRFGLYFRDGEIVEASALRLGAWDGAKRGEVRAVAGEEGAEAKSLRLREMASKIVRLSEGHFIFQTGDSTAAEAGVAIGVDALLLDAFREKDEGGRDRAGAEPARKASAAGGGLRRGEERGNDRRLLRSIAGWRPNWWPRG